MFYCVGLIRRAGNFLSRWLLIVVFALIIPVFLLPEPVATRTYSSKIPHRTEIRDYKVYGTTPGQLVAYMKRRPFRGDNGPAMANIRPRYDLKTVTNKTKKKCEIDRVNLSVRFVMTLPKSMESGKQSKNTRHAWRSFRAFAQRHEEQHRRIYMQCARDFVRKAVKLSPERSCGRLQRRVKTLLKEQEEECDKKHLAFDRRDFAKVPALSLFRQARREKLRSTKRTR